MFDLFSFFFKFKIELDLYFDLCQRAEKIIQVGLNMHLYDDIGDASSSLRGSTSSFYLLQLSAFSVGLLVSHPLLAVVLLFLLFFPFSVGKTLCPSSTPPRPRPPSPVTRTRALLPTISRTTTTRTTPPPRPCPGTPRTTPPQTTTLLRKSMGGWTG